MKVSKKYVTIIRLSTGDRDGNVFKKPRNWLVIFLNKVLYDG